MTDYLRWASDFEGRVTCRLGLLLYSRSMADLDNEWSISPKRVGLALLVGSALTLGWLLACPKYTINGQWRTPSTYQHWLGGRWRTADFEHLDGALFFGGVVVIWTAVGGICLLAPRLRRWWAGLEVGDSIHYARTGEPPAPAEKPTSGGDSPPGQG